MIIERENNATVCAPCLSSGSGALEKLKTFRGNALLTINDLFALMIVPSADRDSFLETLTCATEIVNNSYVTQTYS